MSSRTPAVTYLITSSPVAGAQRQVHDLALAMRDRGWQVRAISMMPVDAGFADLPGAGVDTISLGMKQGVPDPRAVWRLQREVRATRPDILHAHMVHANLLARLARPLARPPVLISTMHNQHQGAHWRDLAYRWTDRLSDLTTTVSQIALDDALRLQIAPRERLRLVPNGIDADAFAADDAMRAAKRAELGLGDEFAWLAAGRLVDAKDYPNMLAAFSHARGTDPAVRLFIAGSGPLDRSIEERITSLGLGDHVTMLGLRSDLRGLMQAADGFVMSSAWEGLPMVLLEAGASALPIVATSVGGSEDAIVEGVTGHLVPPGDATALGNAMLEVSRLDPGARRRMGDAARLHVRERFDLGSIAREWDAIYRELLARKGWTA